MKCLICGKNFKRVCSHVFHTHKMTARQYKEEFGLDVKKGLIDDGFREILHNHVMKNYSKVVAINLIKNGKKTRFKKGHNINYIRSAQTMQRLKNLWKSNSKTTTCTH